MIVHGSPEWYAERIGIPTASEIWRLMPTSDPITPLANQEIDFRKPRASSKLRPYSDSETWAKYNNEKLVERILGVPSERYVNKAMQHGLDNEEEAISEYEVQTGNIVMPAHWIRMDTWGCTPDGFVDDDGIVSIKCPQTETFVWQLAYDQRIDPKNYWQAIAELAATGRAWVDLAMYDPRLPIQSRMHIRRIPRNESAISRLLSEIQRFCDYLDDKTIDLGVAWPPGSDDVGMKLLAG